MNRLILLPYIFVIVVSSATAQWQPDGIPMCNATNHQLNPVAVSDASSAILVWEDYRSGEPDIFAQKVNSSGVAQWQSNGINVSNALKLQLNPAAVSDGSGGVIVIWEDYRDGATGPNIYAQRISSNGTALWTSSGVPICDTTGAQMRAVLIGDGQGGAMIAWEDYRSGSADIYAQRISASGVVQWQHNGIPLIAVTGGRYVPVIAADGSGGAMIAFLENRVGTEVDIYAQRVTAAGVRQWGNGGLAVCTATGVQTQIAAYSTGSNMLLAWQDYRGNSADIYANILTPSGLAWQGNGTAVCTEPGTQEAPRPVPDGRGGMIVAWTDYRNNSPGNIYARRVNSAGAVQWLSGGVPLCTRSETQMDVDIIPIAAGGAIVSWMDYRDPAGDIYAQAVDSSGAPKWQANGSPVCTDISRQHQQCIVPDHSGGGYVAWTDYRSRFGDIYVQRINQYGTALPVELLSFGAAQHSEGALLRWRTASETNVHGFDIQRKQAGGWMSVGFLPAASPDGAEYRHIVAGVYEGMFRLRIVDYDGSESFSPGVVLHAVAPTSLALLSLSPFPASNVLTVEFEVAASGPVDIIIRDLAGRKLLSVNEGVVAAGRSMRILNTAALSSGVYLVELHSQGAVASAKLSIQR
jgi:hypothetical protein